MMPGQLGPTEQLMKLQASLFAKILKVASAVETIEKSGYNKHQSYSYSTEQDLINSVRKLLFDNKLIILTDSETKEITKISKVDKEGRTSDSLVTTVNTIHTFCDSETGATYSIRSTGAGHDNTDKGVYKGITGAMKYFISKNFLVPTEDDPESDGVSKSATTATPKGFNRTPKIIATNPTDNGMGSASAGGAITKPVVETVVVKTDEPVKLTTTAAATTVTTPKPSFGRRAVQTTIPSGLPVTAVKTEPKFP